MKTIGKVPKWLLALGILVALGAAASFYYNYEEATITRLYVEASGNPPAFRNSMESREALRKLSAYPGERVTDILLTIALRGSPLAPEVQAEAISALRTRNDPRIAPALANLLQPHGSLQTRKAVATALRDLPCKGACVRSILHYLERIWRGDPNDEDRWILPSGIEGVAATYKTQQQEIYGNLDSVLRREQAETRRILTEVYAVGSIAPSTFALDLLSRLTLTEACPDLMKSEQQLNDLSPESFRAPRQELQSVVGKLKCK